MSAIDGIVLRKRRLASDAEPFLNLESGIPDSLAPTPEPNVTTTLLQVGVAGEAKLEEGRLHKPHFFWSVLFTLLGFATRYYAIWRGDFVLYPIIF